MDKKLWLAFWATVYIVNRCYVVIVHTLAC